MLAARVAAGIAAARHGTVRLVASGMVVDAFRAEAERLSEMVSGIDEAGFTRPGPCPPWTVGELLYHVRIAVGRVTGMLAEPEPAEDPLVSAVGYYRPGQRFSSATTTDRITAARKGAAALATGTAIGVLPGLARRQGISDMLHRTASRVPGKLAIVSAATRLTFAELDAAVSRTAAALAAEGLKKGDRLALLSRNCWQFAVLSFATARLGVILVPVNFMLGPGEIAYLLSHSEATAFVAEDALAATADKAIAAAGRGVSARAVIRLSPGDVPAGWADVQQKGASA